MALEPKLIDVTVPARPAAAVLVLHGGGSRRGNMMVSPAQLSVLRMVPIAHRIARVGADRLAVFRLLNSRRGWDTQHTPVQDAHWALDEIAGRLGPHLPTCLVGHSLGGRAALLAAGRPEVRSVVALAPWVYADDVADELSGERILIVHGSQDRVASPERSAALARRLSAQAEVAFITVRGGKHAMLARHAVFTGLATEFVAATLLGVSEHGDGAIARVEAGENWIAV
ncbi:MAG: alpha/beta fold hydrolase [Solirubrobacterales bacterium]|nr:alpha/beta fold hydrolase [Solirubrobacterales bacterium]